ncbi:MAG: BMC domain-containing protein [Cyanothece sp. SIO1E1]|nr:BMC domain-containing protein [Cyanothece sp. SIO1E1]
MLEAKAQVKLSGPLQPVKPRQSSPESALGLLSTQSFPATVGAADMMLKSAGVTLVGYEKIGSGYCTVIVRGNTADVRLAVEEGAKTAERFGQVVSKLVIPRPMPNLEAVFPIGSHLAEIARQQKGYSRLSNQAIGLLETRGFPAMVGAADAMLKSAEVHLASYETTGAGLCTAIIRGSVANVVVAIDAGMHEAERIGELNSVMVIPRLLEDLEHALPIASCWLEKPQPLPLLLPQKVKEKELMPVSLEPVQLPEAEKIELPMQEKKMELPIEESGEQ